MESGDLEETPPDEVGPRSSEETDAVDSASVSLAVTFPFRAVAAEGASDCEASRQAPAPCRSTAGMQASFSAAARRDVRVERGGDASVGILY